MNPLRSFQFVPFPSRITIGMALVVWTVWWWADQYQTPIGPIVLAFALRLMALPAMKLWQEAQARQTLRTHTKATVFLILCTCAATAFALWLNSEWVVQIALTVLQFIWGAGVIWFAMFAPDDLDRRSSGLNLAPQHVSGANIIIGASAILSAFTSAALMRLAPDAVWVAFMTIGQIFLLILARWVAVMWILSLPEDTDAGRDT